MLLGPYHPAFWVALRVAALIPRNFSVTLLGPFAYPGVLGKVKIPWIFKDKSMLLWLFINLKI